MTQLISYSTTEIMMSDLTELNLRGLLGLGGGITSPLP